MQVRVNGQILQFPDYTRVSNLLTFLHLQPEGVAVERNRVVLEREQFAQVVLTEGDELEVVRFVGGG